MKHSVGDKYFFVILCFLSLVKKMTQSEMQVRGFLLNHVFKNLIKNSLCAQLQVDESKLQSCRADRDDFFAIAECFLDATVGAGPPMFSTISVKKEHQAITRIFF